MGYKALYRKFRPQVFEDVSGQEHIVMTLKNQIKYQRIGHAYLFCGTRGTGKTTIAKIFARAVNCTNPREGEPCGECDMCQGIQKGNLFNVVEIDAASNNGVDNIRQIIEEVTYPPTQGKYKVYIIDEVHMLSAGAFNALLKTLEEPPSYVIFILATTEVHRIPITILSRCQRYDFRRLEVDKILERLEELTKKENVVTDKEALELIARRGDGSMRDSLSILERCIAFHLGQPLTRDKVIQVLGATKTQVYEELTQSIGGKDVGKVLAKLDESILEGINIRQFATDYIQFLRNLLLLKIAPELEMTIDMEKSGINRLIDLGRDISQDALIRHIKILAELVDKLRYQTDGRILLETTFIRLCKPQMDMNIEGLLERIDTLEQRLEQLQQGGIVSVYREEAPKVVEEEEIVQKPPATPQELQKIKAGWQQVIAHLAEDKIYQRLGARGRLCFVEEEPQVLYLSYEPGVATSLDKDKLIELLDKGIQKEFDRKVPIKIVIDQPRGGLKLHDVEIIEKIQEKINFPIEVEDN